MAFRNKNIGQSCGALTQVAEQILTGFIPLELNNITSRLAERMRFSQGTLQNGGSISSDFLMGPDFGLLFAVSDHHGCSV